VSEAPNFEGILNELETIVERLQRPDLPLDQAIALFQRGSRLAEESERLLSAAELQVKDLTRSVQERVEAYDIADTLPLEE
jgi:exodeoxyribonuclease VII small subunit